MPGLPFARAMPAQRVREKTMLLRRLKVYKFLHRVQKPERKIPFLHALLRFFLA